MNPLLAYDPTHWVSAFLALIFKKDGDIVRHAVMVTLEFRLNRAWLNFLGQAVSDGVCRSFHFSHMDENRIFPARTEY